MTKFVKIQSCYRGHTEDELINIDDISRVCLGPNILFLRTPYNLGEHLQKKNGLEDLKKARKNLDWLIEEFEVEK